MAVDGVITRGRAGRNVGRQGPGCGRPGSFAPLETALKRTSGGDGGDGPAAAIAVPVPAAAEVARLVDDEKVLGACLLEPDCHLQTAPAAEDEHVNVGDSRVPLCRLEVGIGCKPLEVAGDVEVLRLAVGPEPLIALIPVLLAQFIGVERARHPAIFRVQPTRHEGLRPLRYSVPYCTSFLLGRQPANY